MEPEAFLAALNQFPVVRTSQYSAVDEDVSSQDLVSDTFPGNRAGSSAALSSQPTPSDAAEANDRRQEPRRPDFWALLEGKLSLLSPQLGMDESRTAALLAAVKDVHHDLVTERLGPDVIQSFLAQAV